MKFDLIVKNGVIVDGSGSPPFRADIGVVGGRIHRIGDLSSYESEVVINAKGLVVTPGFIDMHNHSDFSIFELPSADNYVLQGVTTIVIGNCGFSAAPLTDSNREEILREVRLEHPEITVKWSSFEEYLEALEKLKPSINIVPLVGHGVVRSAVLGFTGVRVSERDLAEMKKLVEEAMKAGAFGLSTGLIYVPGVFADRSELLELLKPVAKFGGLYFTHMRNEGVGLIDSVIETVELGLEASIGVEISHLKSCGRANWGKVRVALDLISEYASRGYDVSADAYPYEAWSTTLTALLPDEYRAGPVEDVLKRISDPRVLEELKSKPSPLALEEGYISWDDIVVSFSPKHREFEGMSIWKIAEKLGLDPLEVVVKLLVGDELATHVIGFTISPDDVEEVISHPLVSIGSDGYIRKQCTGKPHPRSYGTFPRVIAKYVRDRKALSLTEAIRKMTSLPARKLGLWDRGLIRPGFKADLVVFDYYTICDTATFANPCSCPKGIKYVVVNGRVVVRDGIADREERRGEVLRKSMY